MWIVTRREVNAIRKTATMFSASRIASTYWTCQPTGILEEPGSADSTFLRDRCRRDNVHQRVSLANLWRLLANASSRAIVSPIIQTLKSRVAGLAIMIISSEWNHKPFQITRLSSKVTRHRKKTEIRYFQVAVRLTWIPLKRISSFMGTYDIMVGVDKECERCRVRRNYLTF
jgi:hypothetical protein